MALSVGSGISAELDPRSGALAAAARARAGLRGRPCDAALVFAAGEYLSDPGGMLQAVHETLEPAALAGCGAQGVLGDGREIETGTGIAVWAASLGTGSATPIQMIVQSGEAGALAGVPDLEGAAGAILLADPFTFPAEPVLQAVNEMLPGGRVLGGVASARLPEGSAALFLGEEIVDGGAVGLRLDGVNLRPCVSQGAAPLGPEMTITACEGNVILELAGRPAYEKLREVVVGLGAEDQGLLQRSGGLLLGIVVEPNKPDYEQGDFLVRPVLGADPRTGAVALGALVRPGQVIRLHARDADSADRDLRLALGNSRRELGDRPPAGALVFACNGRGRSLFGSPDHDAAAVADALAGAPSAGFFAAGEIGPVGRECFLHGFTATIALFSD